MAFKKPPIGKRGYDQEEVDAFLDEVEQQLIRLLEDNDALRGQLHRGGTGGTSPAVAGINAEFSAITAQLERVQQARARAEHNARSLQVQLEQARAAGPAPSGDGDDGRAGVLAMAQRTADDHMRDARHESDTLLSAAQDKSQQITREAQIKASTIEGDARRNHAEAMTSLVAKRAALLDEIDRLSQLAESYRAALESHLTQQLQELDGAATAPPERELG